MFTLLCAALSKTTETSCFIRKIKIQTNPVYRCLFSYLSLRTMFELIFWATRHSNQRSQISKYVEFVCFRIGLHHYSKSFDVLSRKYNHIISSNILCKTWYMYFNKFTDAKRFQMNETIVFQSRNYLPIMKSCGFPRHFME